MTKAKLSHTATGITTTTTTNRITSAQPPSYIARVASRARSRRDADEIVPDSEEERVSKQERGTIQSSVGSTSENASDANNEERFAQRSWLEGPGYGSLGYIIRILGIGPNLEFLNVALKEMDLCPQEDVDLDEVESG